ncbi:MAG: glycosyltransferase [Candidatus Asgardarchaeia archaeon]
MYASDLVITTAGKSTIDECLIYGTPVIAIPIKNHFEQERNARRVGNSYSDLEKLDSLILDKIKAGRRKPIQNNLKIAIDLIDKMMN